MLKVLPVFGGAWIVAVASSVAVAQEVGGTVVDQNTLVPIGVAVAVGLFVVVRAFKLGQQLERVFRKLEDLETLQKMVAENRAAIEANKAALAATKGERR